jgi:hypothetical protein
VRVHDPDVQPELALRQRDRLFEVGVVGDDDGGVAVAAEGVEEELRGEVDV